MVPLYITSMQAAGKTALFAGIGRKLLDRGSKVGFLIPVHLSETANADGCEDAAFIREVLGLAESEEVLCPIRLSQSRLWLRLTDEITEFTQRLKNSYRKIARGKDIVIMEGPGNLGMDKVSTLACYTIAEALEARVMIVLRYSPGLDTSEVSKISKKLGQRLLGVVISFVPESKMAVIKPQLMTSLNDNGIRVFGVLPEVRSLLGVSVRSLAEVLGGEILTSPDKADQIVASIMLGTMTLDSGIQYFGTRTNKAVVIRGERPDMQLAALETPMQCMIITNEGKPLPVVVSQAEDKHVPIIVVKQDTNATIAGIDQALAQASFRNAQKLQIFSDVLDRWFDLKALYAELDTRT